MSRDELARAAELLYEAANQADNEGRQQRLEHQAEEFVALADADRGPDHGKLARHEHILSELATEEAGAAESIETALTSIRAYRATIEGV